MSIEVLYQFKYHVCVLNGLDFYFENIGPDICEIVAKYAVAKGFKLPTPPAAIDLLAKEFSRVARA
jgi:hypothetical protein